MRKLRLISKFMTSETRKQIITMHILPKKEKYLSYYIILTDQFHCLIDFTSYIYVCFNMGNMYVLIICFPFYDVIAFLLSCFPRRPEKSREKSFCSFNHF